MPADADTLTSAEEVAQDLPQDYPEGPLGDLEARSRRAHTRIAPDPSHDMLAESCRGSEPRLAPVLTDDFPVGRDGGRDPRMDRQSPKPHSVLPLWSPDPADTTPPERSGKASSLLQWGRKRVSSIIKKNPPNPRQPSAPPLPGHGIDPLPPADDRLPVPPSPELIRISHRHLPEPEGPENPTAYGYIASQHHRYAIPCFGSGAHAPGAKVALVPLSTGIPAGCPYVNCDHHRGMYSRPNPCT